MVECYYSGLKWTLKGRWLYVIGLNKFKYQCINLLYTTKDVYQQGIRKCIVEHLQEIVKCINQQVNRTS